MVQSELARLPADVESDPSATATLAALRQTVQLAHALFPAPVPPVVRPAHPSRELAELTVGSDEAKALRDRAGAATQVLLQTAAQSDHPPRAPPTLAASVPGPLVVAGDVAPPTVPDRSDSGEATTTSTGGARPLSLAPSRNPSAAQAEAVPYALPAGFTARLVVANECPQGFGSWRAVEWRGPEKVHFPELFEGLTAWNLLLGDEGAPLRVELRDASDKLVDSGPAAFAPLTVHLLHCGAGPGKQCASYAVHKTGKGGRPEKLLEAGTTYVLSHGVCHLTGLRVKTNSSGAHNNEYKLGVCLGVADATLSAPTAQGGGAEGAPQQQMPVRCLDAITRAFRVKARRAEAIRKHHPAEILLDSEVWRLVHIKRDSRKVQQLRTLLAGRLNDPSVLRGPTVRHLVTQFAEDQWAIQLGIQDESYADETLDHVQCAIRNSDEKARLEAARGSAQAGFMHQVMRLALSAGAVPGQLPHGGPADSHSHDLSGLLSGDEHRALSLHFGGGQAGGFGHHALLGSMGLTGDGTFPFVIARSETAAPGAMGARGHHNTVGAGGLMNSAAAAAANAAFTPQAMLSSSFLLPGASHLDPGRSESLGRLLDLLPERSWEPMGVQSQHQQLQQAHKGAAAHAVAAAQALAVEGVDRLRQLSHVAEELSVDGEITQQQLQQQAMVQLQLQQLQALHHLHAQQQAASGWMQHQGIGQGSAGVGVPHPGFMHERLT
jgi:hypothetical protein